MPHRKEPTDPGSSTGRPSSSVSGLPTSTVRPGIFSDPIPIAEKLISLWGRMIDAPLEKILADDCSAEAYGLLRQLNEASVMPGPPEVMAAIRAVAVGLDLLPPEGPALKIYFKVLGALPLVPLMAATEELVKTYTYSSFPKPGHWLALANENARLIERCRFMMTLYENRRKIAELRYGRKPARRQPSSPASPAQVPGDFDLE